MIAQPSLGSYLKGLLHYNESKVGEGVAALLCVNSVDGELSTFEAQYHYLVADRRDQKNLLHVSLNFPEDDRPRLTPEMYIQVTKDFLEAYGFPTDHPFALYQHTDKNHPHVHIATPLILENGKPIDQSFMVKKMIRITRQLETKHALTPVRKKGPKIAVSHVPFGKDENFEQANEAIERALRNVIARKPTSFKDLDKYLRRIELTYNNQPCGLGYAINKLGNGITFFLQSKDGEGGGEDGKGTQVCRGIKGSKLAGLSFSRLQGTLEANKGLAAARKPAVRELIAAALALLPAGSTLASFRQKLTDLGVESNLYYTKTGELFGMDFRDLQTGITYAGSDLDKRYSWNVLKKVLKVSGDTGEVEQKHEISAPDSSKSKPMSIIADLKRHITLTDLVEKHGYFENEQESTKAYLFYEKNASKIRIYDHGADGLYFVDCDDPNKKGDILNFLIDMNISPKIDLAPKDKKTNAAIQYLLNEYPHLSRPLKPKKDTTKLRQKEGTFQPIAVHPFNAENYLVASRSIPLSILEKDFTGAVFSSDRIELPVGDGDAKLLIPKNSAIFPLLHLETGLVVGQMIRNNSLRSLKEYSDKTFGIWDSNPRLSTDVVTILEDAIDAISHRALFPDHPGKYITTMGNPSQKVMQYISALITDPARTVTLAGDNDRGGQRQNLLYLLDAHAKTGGIKISVSIAEDESSYNLKLTCPDATTRDREYALFELVAARIGQQDVALELEALTIKARFRNHKDVLFQLVQVLIDIFRLLKTFVIRPKNKDYNDDLKEVMAQKQSRDIRHRPGPKL
jgi:hypothetical protein